MNQRGGRDGALVNASVGIVSSFRCEVVVSGRGLGRWSVVGTRPTEAGTDGGRSALCVRVLEDLVEADVECAGDLEGHLERGRVLALLDGDDRLARDADSIGQV